MVRYAIDALFCNKTHIDFTSDAVSRAVIEYRRLHKYLSQADLLSDTSKYLQADDVLRMTEV